MRRRETSAGRAHPERQGRPAGDVDVRVCPEVGLAIVKPGRLGDQQTPGRDGGRSRVSARPRENDGPSARLNQTQARARFAQVTHESRHGPRHRSAQRTRQRPRATRQHGIASKDEALLGGESGEGRVRREDDGVGQSSRPARGATEFGPIQRQGTDGAESSVIGRGHFATTAQSRATGEGAGPADVNRTRGV